MNKEGSAHQFPTSSAKSLGEPMQKVFSPSENKKKVLKGFFFLLKNAFFFKGKGLA